MPTYIRRSLRLLVVCLTSTLCAAASAYNARPKLIVIIVIDQFRGDYLERYHDQFMEGGLRMLMERGAYFTECYYDYANTRTAPGHATLGTGAYTNGHGIGLNDWWSSKKDGDGMVTSVYDESTKMVGPDAGAVGASPRNLLASTLADELRLATQGRSRTFGISLKDRGAILPVGYSANGVYWIQKNAGDWQTSTYYMSALPAWVAEFNKADRAEKYWNLDWKDASGKVIGSTKHQDGPTGPLGFYDVVGETPFSTDYELEFARELVTREKLGQGETTDLLVVSLSAFDILGHRAGPDSPERKEMALATDRQLADFFGFLGRQVGLANLWIALSADHGIVPLPADAKRLHIPGYGFDEGLMFGPVNVFLAKKFNKPINQYVASINWPYMFLNRELLGNIKEEDAEKAVGEYLMTQKGVRGFYTRAQLARGDVRNDEYGRMYLHSFIPKSEWYTMAVPDTFATDTLEGVDHLTPYSYDTHVPLLFYGLPFQPGVYRTHAEPVDLAVTLASLLGVNKPSHAVGRVLTEAIKETPRESGKKEQQ